MATPCPTQSRIGSFASLATLFGEALGKALPLALWRSNVKVLTTEHHPAAAMAAGK
jgi:hypothetical protein